MIDLSAHESFVQRCKEAEWYETPVWAAERILDVELLTPRVLDPCAGRGVLGDALIAKGYDPLEVVEIDLNRWPGQSRRVTTPIDFLCPTIREELLPLIDEPHSWKGREFSVMMNPPFSKACEFVDHAFDLGARKVLMFQRFSFLESASRRKFFERRPPARVWLCGDRALCWRGDVPEEDVLDDTGKVIIKGKKGRSTPTAHAWFVWEAHHAGAMQVHHLYRD